MRTNCLTNFREGERKQAKDTHTHTHTHTEERGEKRDRERLERNRFNRIEAAVKIGGNEGDTSKPNFCAHYFNIFPRKQRRWGEGEEEGERR